ncbi:MAG: T9SS type A sorting domain-containing protein [Bacteroidia bacterium]
MTITRSIIITALLNFTLALNGQNLNYIPNWSNAGNYSKINSSKTVHINDFESNNNGSTSNNSAFTNALKTLGNQGGIIKFGRGTYLFTSGISIPNNVHIKGEGANTNLAFELSTEQDAISFTGSIELRKYKLAKSAFRSNNTIQLKSTDNLKINDLIKISAPNSNLTTTTWAKESIAQITKIKSINGNKITIEDELRINFLMADDALVQKIIPLKNAGLSCIQIITKDSTANNGSNIKMLYTENCYVKNVISEYCNYAHIELDNNYRTQVSGSFLRFAHNYNKGIKGNGILIRNSSSNCLIENNCFSFLVHSLSIESGANGNVVSYNYSERTYWEKPNEPSNASADLLLNGNYPFANLFEGNIFQNISISNKNGTNGPNTFFCTWADLFGFSMHKNSADSLNIIKTRVTNNLPQFGKFNLSGNGHFEYKTLIVNKKRFDSLPVIDTVSFYINDSAFFTFLKNDYRNLAEKRYEENTYINCGNATDISSELDPDTVQIKYSETAINNIEEPNISIYPIPTKDFLYIKINQSCSFNGLIIDANGKPVEQFKMPEGMPKNNYKIATGHLNNGFYSLVIFADNYIITKRFVISH